MFSNTMIVSYVCIKHSTQNTNENLYMMSLEALLRLNVDEVLLNV